MSGRMRLPFAHNDACALHAVLLAPDAGSSELMIREGKCGMFVDSESVHHTNGTVSPLRAILGTTSEVVPYGQGTLVVAGAYAMGLYGLRERGMVTCSAGLGPRVIALSIAHIRL
jgi:7-keto-8-aminopelargonate synthetase-like enzyme